MFADDTCIHVSDAYYDNVVSTIQLSADEVLNLATNNFMTIHPKTKQPKEHEHYYVAKASKNFTI